MATFVLLVACNSDIGIAYHVSSGMPEGEFRLTASERTELRDRLRSRTQPAEDVRRARLILLLAQGKSYVDSPGAELHVMVHAREDMLSRKSRRCPIFGNHRPFTRFPGES
jgi:hypothetical protein